MSSDPSRPTPRAPAQEAAGSSASAAATLAACVLAAAAFLFAWWSDPRRPGAASLTDGWWSGYDQGRYLQSAVAFAHGDFSPASHWYLPLYPALASLFAGLTPADPFVVPNLACLLASAWLMAGLGADLVLPGGAVTGTRGRLAGLFAFLACAVAPPAALHAWVVPWTSTLAVPLMLSCLRATLATLARPHAAWPPVLAGLSGAAVAGCRPVDAVLLLACAAACAAWRVLRTRGAGAVLSRWAPRFALGVLAGLLPTLCLYGAVWGLHESPYLVSSADIGFEWRLLPLHWVALMISPRPLVADGAGLIQGLPFIGLGLLGAAACLLTGRPSERGAHLFVLAAVLSSALLYLAYRDLHAPGLWQFSNYHYFKWSFGLLGLYTLLLLRALLLRPTLRLLWLLPLAAGLAGWRVTPQRSARATGTVTAPDSFEIPVPALGVNDAVVVAAGGAFDPIYFGTHALRIGDTPILPIRDFKAMPIEGGLMLTPLRPWPAGTLSVRFVPGITLDPAPAPFVAHMRLRPGLPCWFGLHQPGCDADGLVPPTALPTGELRFDGHETRYLGTGWSYAEPGGRWTAAHEAELRFRLPGAAAAQAAEVTLRASAIWRDGLEPMEVEIRAGDTTLSRFTLADGNMHDLSVTLPPASIGADGAVRLWVVIRNPHSPRDIFPPSGDTRLLGISVRAVAWRWLPG